MDLQNLLTSLAGLSALLASLTVAPSALPAAAVTPALQATPASIAAPSHDLALSLGDLRDALVNIVCVSGDKTVHSGTATGVIIDPRGLILTVSHMGQYFLLQDRDPDVVQCVIRTGNPARKAYTAEPVYISGPWLKKNPNVLTDDVSRGTGENDFAVLAITGTATSTPLPSVFPYVPLTEANAIPAKNQRVAVGGYAAQTLTTKQIQQFLYQTLVFGSVQERYTFATGTVDAISVGGSAAAQEGSSGGGVTNELGQLMGIITTSTIDGDLIDRNLHAITINHIRRSFLNDTGESFDSYLANTSLRDLVYNFKREDAKLAKELVNNIKRAR